MKIRGSLIVMFVSALIALPLKIYQITNLVEDYSTGFLKNGAFVNYAVPALVAVFSLVMFIMAFASQNAPLHSPMRKAPVMAIVSILFSLLVGYQSVMALFNEEARTFSGNAGIFYAAFGLTTVMALIYLAVALFKGDNTVENTPLIMIFPFIWSAIRLVLTFLDTTRVANISERMYDLLMLVGVMLFMLSAGRFMAGSAEKSSKWLFACGAPAALLALLTTIPRYILPYKLKNRIGADGVSLAETLADSPFTANLIDVGLAIFIISFLFYASSGAEKSAAVGGVFDTNMAQRYGGPAAAAVQQNAPVKPAQNPTVRQGQMPAQAQLQQRAPMPQRAMGYPQGMPYGQMPYGQMPMPYGQMPYGQMPMPYGQMPYGQMPYGQMPPYGQMQLGQPHAVQNARKAQPLLKGGGADSFTAKGAGMRIADQFAVRQVYASEKKFGGLDDFRNNMLSGRRALEVLENSTDENVIEEEGNAQTVLASQDAEIGAMTEEIERSIGDIETSEQNNGAPIEQSVSAPDDDGEIVVPVVDEEEEEHQQSIALGTRKGGGRLSDRLSELDERRQRRASYDEEAYDEEEYDEYGEDEYEETPYDEYEDEEYGAGEYDYQYADSRYGAPYGGRRKRAPYVDEEYDEYSEEGEYEEGGEYEEEEYDEYEDDEYEDDEYEEEEYEDDEYYYDDDEEYDEDDDSYYEE